MSHTAHVRDVIETIRNNTPTHHDAQALNITRSTKDHTAHMAFIIYRQLIHNCVHTADTILKHHTYDRYMLCIKLLKYIIEQQALLHKLTHDIIYHGLEKHIVEPFVGTSRSLDMYETIEEMDRTHTGYQDVYDRLLHAITHDTDSRTLTYDEILSYLENTLQNLQTFTTSIHRLILLLPSHD